jgi:hypothetical protein
MDSTITHFLYGTGQARHGHETAGVREGGGEGEDDSVIVIHVVVVVSSRGG